MLILFSININTVQIMKNYEKLLVNNCVKCFTLIQNVLVNNV